MKKTIIYAIGAIIALAGFASCTGEQAQPPVVLPVGGVGNGTWNNPMTAYQASLGALANDTIEQEDGSALVTTRETSWVKGYIVGYIDVNITNVMKEETCTFTVPATVATNIVIAANPNETDWTKCVPVQLPSGDVRSALNLQDHPENIGALVTLYGITGQKYCSAYGVRSVTKYKWGAEGIFTPKTIFSAPFTNSDWAGFTVDNGGDNTVWTLDNRYGLVAKGRFDNVNTALKASVISPAVYLGKAEKPVISFEWAGNYFSGINNFKKLVQVMVREPEGEWQELDIPVYPNGTSWDFVNSGAISLETFKGKKVQIGIFYESTVSISGTLELRGLQIFDGTQLESTPQQ